MKSFLSSRPFFTIAISLYRSINLTVSLPHFLEDQFDRSLYIGSKTLSLLNVQLLGPFHTVKDKRIHI